MGYSWGQMEMNIIWTGCYLLLFFALRTEEKYISVCVYVVVVVMKYIQKDV